jgi:hypothetical protein
MHLAFLWCAAQKTCGFAIVASFATVLCGTSGADEAAKHYTPLSTGKLAIGRKLSLAGVPNFGEVNSTLYRGAQPTREGFAKLAKLGISIVVDVRGGTQERARASKQARNAVHRDPLALLPSARRKICAVPHAIA